MNNTKIQFLLISFSTFLSFFGFGQIDPIDVAELTLKIGATKTEEIFYGFDEGDQIVFSFEELKGKVLKEIKITELPTNSKFMDFKSSLIVDKKIMVNKKSVYKFSFTNSALSGRICKIKIQRTPKSADQIAFNTDWEWKTEYDTTYTPYTEDSIIGYDTTYSSYTKNEVARIDTIYEEIRSAKNKIWVYSGGNISACFGNSASCTKQMITLKYHNNTDALLIWVGVGQETRNSYNNLSKNIAKMTLKGGIRYLSGGSSILAAAFTNIALSQLIKTIPTSDNVLDVFLTNSQTASEWYRDYSTNIYNYCYKGLAYKDLSNLHITLKKELGQIAPNTMTLCLKNDSKIVGTDAYINVIGIRYKKIYEDIVYQKEKITPKKITLNKLRMDISKNQIRVNQSN